MALTQHTLRHFELGYTQEYPVAAGAMIYEGAAVGLASGYARPLVAGDAFMGFSVQTANTVGKAAGADRVRVRFYGQVVLEVAGATAVTANAGAKVYAADDGTFTLTAGSNSVIGRVSRWEAGTRCVVAFDAIQAKGALAAP